MLANQATLFRILLGLSDNRAGGIDQSDYVGQAYESLVDISQRDSGQLANFQMAFINLNEKRNADLYQ